MKVYTYAILKDYFDKELLIDEPLLTITQLQQYLQQRNPAAGNILSTCRYAVQNQFVTGEFTIQPGDDIHIIPPSSGG
jgi:sulfur-carrier protein